MNFILPLVTITSSFCTMSYAMVMAGVMSDFTGEEILSQCLTMGPYLLGLGIGSSLGDRVDAEKRLHRLWQLEWVSVLLLPLIPLLQVLSIFLFTNLAPPFVALDGIIGLRTLLSITAVFSITAGLLGGAQLPLIMKIHRTANESTLLALNYLGPLFAGIAVVGMNTHAVPVELQVYAIGLVQLLGLLCLVFLFPKRFRSLVLLFLPLSFLIGGGHLYTKLELLTLKSVYLGTKISPKDLRHPGAFLDLLQKYGSVERLHTPYQTIDLFIEPPNLSYSVPGNASVYLNRKPQFDLFSVRTYHETMVYGGMNLLGHTPKNILVLGAGDGLLLKELRPFTGVQHITMVELDAQMIEWSRTNHVVSNLNQRIFDQLPKNVELITGDAVTFLRNPRREKYDLILIDFPFPNGHELAKLYSMEFYQLVQRSLAPEGLVVLDLPLYLDHGALSQESKVILRSMKASGLLNPLLFGPAASFVAVKAGEQKLKFDYEKFPEGLLLASYLNFATPFREEDITDSEWKTVPVNTMFWPRGL